MADTLVQRLGYLLGRIQQIKTDMSDSEDSACLAEEFDGTENTLQSTIALITTINNEIINFKVLVEVFPAERPAKDPSTS